MENISEVTTRVLLGPLPGRLSSQTRESESAIRRGMEQAVPISIVGLAAHAASQENAAELLARLRGGAYPHVDAGEIGQAVENHEATSRLVESGASFLRGLLGHQRVDTAVDAIAGQSGVSRTTASTLLALTAPLVMEVVGKQAGARQLDARGLSQFLAEQGRSASGALPPGVLPSSMFAGTRANARGVESRAAATTPHARERPRGSIEERQAGQARDANRRRVGAWVAATLAVLAALLLMGRRSVPRPQAGIETPRAGQQQPVAPPVQQGPAREGAPGGVPAAATLSPTSGAGALATFLSGTEPTPKRFVLEGIQFATDSLPIRENAVLDAVAAQLALHPSARIRIEAFGAGSGAAEESADASEARANSIKSYLIGRGIAPARTEVQGYPGQPATQVPAGAPQTPRVELVVTAR